MLAAMKQHGPGKSIQNSVFGFQEVNEQGLGVRCRVPGAKPGFRIQESGVRMKSICFPPSAYCQLPTESEGGWRWRDSWPVPHSATRCHRGQRKRKLVISKIEGTIREC